MKHGRKEERLMVLQMVAENKITVEESIKLLEALGAGKSEECRYEPNYNFDEKMEKFYRNVDDFSKDVGGKFSDAYKDVEPKIKKATKVVVEKTASLLEEISKSLNETLDNLREEAQENPCDCGCEDGREHKPGDECCDECPGCGEPECEEKNDDTPIPN